MGFFVMELRKVYGDLKAGECYGCKTPLSLGGKLEADNFERTDIHTHYSVPVQLPPGTKIDSIKIESGHEETKPKTWWQKVRDRME